MRRVAVYGLLIGCFLPGQHLIALGADPHAGDDSLVRQNERLREEVSALRQDVQDLKINRDTFPTPPRREP